MKIIDFHKRGNVIRLFLGDNDCDNYTGDDWDDVPYEHNAGHVYDEYVKGYIDIVVPFDCAVIEPSDDWCYNGNTPYCQNDFKNSTVPCLIICSEQVTQKEWGYPAYSKHIDDQECLPIFLNTVTNQAFKAQLKEHEIEIIKKHKKDENNSSE